LAGIHEVDTTKNTVFVGRKEELKRLFNKIDKVKSITVIVGEEGIGKSSLIQEFCKRLKNTKNPPFIGVYDNNSVSENNSQSLIFPVMFALEGLRLKNALEKFARQKGKETASAILTDVAKKIGLEETLKVAKEFLTTFEGEKSIIMVTQVLAQNTKK